MDTLALKLILTPLLVGAASLAGRRWGPSVSGWFVALPWTSGPIVFFLALSHGPAFAAATSAGILLGAFSTIIFCLVYAWLAARWRGAWPASLAGSYLAFLAVTAVLSQVTLGWPIQFVVVLLSLGLALRLMPRPAAGGRLGSERAADSPTDAAPLPSWDIPARMLVGTAFVVLITGAAPALGPQLTGLLSPFPVFTSTLVIFAHHLHGPEAAVNVLRGLLHGMVAYISFFMVLAALLERAGLVTAFAAAIAVALLLHTGTFWVLRHREGARAVAGRPAPAAAPRVRGQ
jgi:uncharacterized membrane protein (GlpM family)